MKLFKSLLCPLKKLWGHLYAARKQQRRGLYILYEDVKSCPCEDVQVLWSILVESQAPLSIQNMNGR
ncbi:hypothetical protein ACHQM5_014791 [Ranunculus cassubicifolius]